MPVDKVNGINKEGLKVEPLKKTLKTAKENEMYSYAYKYMRYKYGYASA